MLRLTDAYLSPSYRDIQIYHQSFFDTDPKCGGLRSKCGRRLRVSWRWSCYVFFPLCLFLWRHRLFDARCSHVFVPSRGRCWWI